jgi:zinc transport system substrate-binding protein
MERDMRKFFPIALSAGMGLGVVAQADVPRVVADIAPVHSLVAQVMQGVGTPDLIVRQGASPHEYSLRPSEAGALDQADVVFWVGDELTPWLDRSIERLAQDATVVSLLDADGTVRLQFREGPIFDQDDHDHDDHSDGDDHDDHSDGDDHDDHADGDSHDDQAAGDDHDDHADEKEAGHDSDDEHGHDHGGVDPHAWLDPGNGKHWLDVISTELARLDPENSALYLENAAKGKADIDEAVKDISAELQSAKSTRFVVLHDAYHYFEGRFGIHAVGAISLSDASDPSPARVQSIQKNVQDLEVTCVFSEPQFNVDIVATVIENSQANSAVLDPLGVGLETGQGFYVKLLRDISGEIAACSKS